MHKLQIVLVSAKEGNFLWLAASTLAGFNLKSICSLCLVIRESCEKLCTGTIVFRICTGWVRWFIRAKSILLVCGAAGTTQAHLAQLAPAQPSKHKNRSVHHGGTNRPVPKIRLVTENGHNTFKLLQLESPVRLTESPSPGLSLSASLALCE